MARGRGRREGDARTEQLENALKILRDLGATDLWERAEQGQLPVAHGRERELERVFDALMERKSVLLLGPTGSGKTFLAKTLAEYLFGTESAGKLVRFDMSEYQSPSSAHFLVRQMTDRLRRQRFSVVLLDEIEKAAPNIFDLFLQAFDDARLTDPEGQTADLRNVVFVMTSNLGGGAVPPRSLGFGADGESSDVDAAGQSEDVGRRLRAVHNAFRPEFINRLDKIVTFKPLGRAAMRRIARRELGRALEREGIRRRGILLDFREDVLDLLLDAGFSAEFGARPLQRAIKEMVLVPLAHRIAADPARTDQLLELRAEDRRVVFDMLPLARSPAIDPGAARPDTSSAPARTPPAFKQLTQAIAELQRRVAEQLQSAPFETVQARSAALIDELARPSFWDDHERARRVNSAIYHLARVTDRLVELRRRIDALAEVPTILQRHHRTTELAELDRLERRVRQLTEQLGLARLELLAATSANGSGLDDVAALGSLGAVLSVVPVSAPGARDAGDWPATLAEMYAGWARRREYDVTSCAGPDADGGYTVHLQSPGIADLLRGEVGLHKRQIAPSGQRGRRPAVALARVSVEPEGLATFVGDDVVRVYHLGSGAYVRDPRTGQRSAHPREVLNGTIDAFLLAYLEQAGAEG